MRNMHAGLGIVLPFATMALLALAGCSGESAGRVELTNAQAGQTVDVAVGQDIQISLQTIGPGEYGTPSLSSSSVQFVGVSNTSRPNPGGPLQLFEFHAAASGLATLDIPHSPAGSAFTLTFDVQ